MKKIFYLFVFTVLMFTVACNEGDENSGGNTTDDTNTHIIVPDTTVDEGDIIMNNLAYKKHTRGIVVFSHTKHYEDYQLKCGECHHNNQGAPLNDIDMNSKVQSCLECHPKTVNPPKGEKLTDLQKQEYHKKMIHKNCIDCHKDFYREKKRKRRNKYSSL